MRHTEEKIQRLQKSLSTLRKVAGWSAENLANLLGVTRQTVVNLESGHSKMSQTQYIAIRALLETEAWFSANKILKELVEILIDDDDVSGKARGKFKKAVDKTLDRAASGVGRRAGSAAASKAAVADLRKLFPILSLTSAIGVVGAVAALASAPWMLDILRKATSLKEGNSMAHKENLVQQYAEGYIVMNEGELVYADVDKESAEGYVEERAYEARAEILNEWGNDDPSAKDLAEAEFQMGFDGFNYSIEKIDLSGLGEDDTVTTSDGTELDVSEIQRMLDDDGDYDDDDDYDDE